MGSTRELFASGKVILGRFGVLKAGWGQFHCPLRFSIKERDIAGWGGRLLRIMTRAARALL